MRGLKDKSLKTRLKRLELFRPGRDIFTPWQVSVAAQAPLANHYGNDVQNRSNGAWSREGDALPSPIFFTSL
jgi:hypothetical protein